MIEPKWLDRALIELIHAKQIERYGGGDGLRDKGLLLSAVAGPQNVFAYEPGADIFAIAATYGVGIIKNHPYVDGNKRTGFLAATLFLQANGYRFRATPKEAELQTVALAAGEIGRDEYAAWLRETSIPA